MSPPMSPPMSPLLISDRLISLAQQADQAGCTRVARRLIGLASTVLDSKSFPPPPPPGLRRGTAGTHYGNG